MAKKSEAVFSSEAKILGVKLKAGNVNSYNATPNKIEIGFEIEMPRPQAVLSRKQWEGSTKYGDDRMPYELSNRKDELEDLRENGGKREVTKGRGKKAETVEETVDVEAFAAQLEEDIQKAYDKYSAKATRVNERAAAAANHAGLFMALGGQTVRLAISPMQASMPGMLALPMPEDLGDPDEDNDDGDED